MARIGVNIVVTEKLLNHAGGVSGDIVAVYQRCDYEPRAARGIRGLRALPARLAGRNRQRQRRTHEPGSMM